MTPLIDLPTPLCPNWRTYTLLPSLTYPYLLYGPPDWLTHSVAPLTDLLTLWPPWLTYSLCGPPDWLTHSVAPLTDLLTLWPPWLIYSLYGPPDWLTHSVASLTDLSFSSIVTSLLMHLDSPDFTCNKGQQRQVRTLVENTTVCSVGISAFNCWNKCHKIFGSVQCTVLKISALLSWSKLSYVLFLLIYGWRKTMPSYIMDSA
jgi:hypothetical protein